jgi:hypothetical protein
MIESKASKPTAETDGSETNVDQQAFVERIRNMIAISRKHKEERKHAQADYDRRNALYHGHTDTTWGRDNEWQAQVEINIVKPVVDTISANVIDSRPEMHFVPKNDRSAAFSDLMESVVESAYQDAEGPLTLQTSYDEAEMHGIGALKITFQPNEDDGAGRILWDSLTIRQCYFDPNYTDPVWLRNCRWFIEVNVISMAQLKSMFGDKADSVQPGVPDEFKYDKAEEDSSGVKVETPVSYPGQTGTTTVSNVGSSMMQGTWGSSEALEGQKLEEQTVLLEVWMMDADEKKPEGQDDQAPVKDEWTVYWLAGSEFTLMDQTRNPYRHQQLPYVLIPTKTGPDHKYGEAEPDTLDGIQTVVNNLIDKFVDIQTITGNPILVNSETDGTDEVVSNTPGQMVRPNSVDGMRWLEMPRAGSGEILAVVQTLRSFGQVASGVLDVMLGERPRGVTTAEGLRTLEERALIRLRPRIRLLGRAVRRAWLLMTSLIQQYYTAERFIAKAGADPSEAQFVRLNQEVTPQQAMTFMRKGLPVGVRQVDDPDTGETRTEYYLNDVTQGEFDVQFSEGPGLPRSRSDRLELAMRLYESPSKAGPAISKQSLLRSVDWPKPEQEVMKIKQETLNDAKTQIQIQSAVAMATAPPPGAAPPAPGGPAPAKQERPMFSESA